MDFNYLRMLFRAYNLMLNKDNQKLQHVYSMVMINKNQNLENNF